VWVAAFRLYSAVHIGSRWKIHDTSAGNHDVHSTFHAITQFQVNTTTTTTTMRLYQTSTSSVDNVIQSQIMQRKLCFVETA